MDHTGYLGTDKFARVTAHCAVDGRLSVNCTRGRIGFGQFPVSPWSGRSRTDPRGGPDLYPRWLMLDLTPEGRGTDCYPKLEDGHK